jgi:large subunit ribosomal protein L9
MKVVFLVDVPKLGKTGEVKEVSDGYAKNYLIPRKLAAIASSGAVNSAQAKLDAEARIQAMNQAQLEAIAAQVNGKEFTIEGQTGGKDRLYGSITNTDIADAIKKGTGLEIDKRRIELGNPIHRIGTYEIGIRLGKDIVPQIKVTVIEKKG